MISQAIIPEIEQEASATKKMLERVPNDQFGWKPHEKSMALGRLAVHVAELPGWITMTIKTNELDFSTWKYDPAVVDSAEELVQVFEKNIKTAVDTLKATSDEELMKPWTMRNGDHIFFTMPRIAVIRTFSMNHLIHHRAQMSVYLRLQNIPVPGMYGPSADEKG
ncbi:MAG TPA: DinB family protein [Flavisolibacter sp.]|nr:DinB family protein [Flavisolibacter sp.]